MSGTKWDRRFLDLAALLATWSRDPSTQVGCVIARPDKTIASVGFNGFARGVEDLRSRYLDREFKYQAILHGEINAILHAREPLHGYTLYVHPFHPCASCAAAIIQSGIKRVVTRSAPVDKLERWAESFAIAEAMFNEAGVAVDILEGAVSG